MISAEVIKIILEYAVRAPSTHNSQPWLFKVKGDKIEIFFDSKYLLPFADKEQRDLYISIGCMIENLKIAALNYKLTTSILFESFTENTKVAEVHLLPSEENPAFLYKQLFNTIPKRINARGLFNKEDIPIGLSEKINLLSDNKDLELSFLNNKNQIENIAQLTKKSIKEAYNQVGFRKEMSQWMNSNLSSKKEGLPGYSLKMPLIVSLIIPILIRYFNIGFFISKLSMKALASAPLMVSIASTDNKRSWIEVGMLAERIMLYLQSVGYQTSIYVGAVEIEENYKKLQEIIGTKNRPQFLFAVGHIPGPHRITPRHRLQDKIID